jgi:hypothetical protein
MEISTYVKDGMKIEAWNDTIIRMEIVVDGVTSTYNAINDSIPLGFFQIRDDFEATTLWSQDLLEDD